MLECPRCSGKNLHCNDVEGYAFCDDCGVCVAEITDDSHENPFIESKRADDTYGSDVPEYFETMYQPGVSKVVRGECQLLVRLCQKFGLPTAVSNDAVKIFLKFVDYKKRRSERISNHTELIGAVIHLSAERAKLSLTLKELNSHLRLDLKAARLEKLKERLSTLLPSNNVAEDRTRTPGGSRSGLAFQRYLEILDRTIPRLLIPGIHLKGMTCAMAMAYEDQVGATSPGVLLCVLLYLIVTTENLALMAGMIRRSVVPRNSPADLVVRRKLMQALGVNADEFDSVSRKITYTILEDVLIPAAEHAVCASNEEKDS